MAHAKKILFIIIDQLRADCIEGKLAEYVNLPNIDLLRKEAVTFTTHFSVTNPCGPSRASIFTGLYAMNHRSVRNGTPLAAGISNIATEARKSGYEPLLFGYTDTSHDPRTGHKNDPRLRSYEEVLPGYREIVEMRFDASYPWRADLIAKGYDLPESKKFYHPVPDKVGRAPRPDDAAFYKAQDSDTAFLTNRFIEEMSVRTEQNWFATVTYIRPHPPLVAPEPYNKMYKGEDLPLPIRMANVAEESRVHPFIGPAADRVRAHHLVPGCADQIDENDDADVQMLRAVYLGLINEVDAHIGRIITFLKETGQFDDTLIVLQADHGEMLGDHHMWDKQHIYEPAFRIPLIIRDPNNRKQYGSTIEAFTESIDITPTILDLMGRQVPAGMDGHSLRPFLEGKSPESWRDCVHLEFDFGDPERPTIWQKELGISLDQANLAILREKKYKLVHFNGDLAPLLYDLENDPDEFVNLADDPSHFGVVLRLTQKLLSLRMRREDRTLADVKITSNGAVNFHA